MSEPKSPKSSNDEIANFLIKTGFIFEMRINENLANKGYSTKIGSSFFDLDSNQEREIDIIASKAISSINVHLIIECKQSFMEKWIFICSSANPPRYYASVKHTPQIDFQERQKADLFESLHMYDRTIPMAQNFVCYSRAVEKQTECLSIRKCIEKLPKATVSFAREFDATERHLFVPIALFAGQMFIARYRNRLLVEERGVIQYQTQLDSAEYKAAPDESIGASQDFRLFESLDEQLGKARVRAIREAHRNFTKLYQLDFVSEEHFDEYINQLESKISKLDDKQWPVVAKIGD